MNVKALLRYLYAPPSNGGSHHRSSHTGLSHTVIDPRQVFGSAEHFPHADKLAQARSIMAEII